MSEEARLLEESAEDLFENAPCGYVSTTLDGTIVRVNRTFEHWTGLRREELLKRKRFQDLLAVGDRIYYETHYAPLLHMQGRIREIALEIMRADGSQLPALVNSTVRTDDSGRPRIVRSTIFDATDRRRYEQELLRERRREQDIAQQLQRSLLAGALPQTPTLDLGVAYRAAERGVEVGGDWYDAFWVEEDATIALVVGDVVGRGIAAAATMGQLRSAVRALAATGLSPAPLLAALDAYARRHGVGAMTTALYAQLRLDSRELSFACAGHPPPLVVGAAASPRLVWEGRSLPLNVPGGPFPREEFSMRLPADGAVLLYTDGLVERRTHSLDEGLAQLERATADRGALPAAALAEELVQALARDQADDVCLVVARLLGGGRSGS